MTARGHDDRKGGMMTARGHDDRKGHHYYIRLRTPAHGYLTLSYLHPILNKL